MRGNHSDRRHWAEVAQQWMRFARATQPQHRAEPARVVVTKRCPIVQHEIDVIVESSRRRRAVNAKTARHAKMHQQCIRAHAEQQVLAATLDRFDRAAAKATSQIGGNWPAQAPVVYVQFRNMPADDMGRDAAAGGFDFGQFRHDGMM